MDRINIGLLRGINVSGANRLAMADLMSAANDAGFKAARTYLQSGNIVFASEAGDNAAIAARLATAIARRCHLTIELMVRTGAEIRAVIAANPFPAAEELPKTLHVFILAAAPTPERLADLAGRDFGTDEWRLEGDTLYLHLPNGMGRSKLGSSVERILKVPMTARNWNTMLALGQMAEDMRGRPSSGAA